MKILAFLILLLTIINSSLQARNSIVVAGKTYFKDKKAIVQVLNKTNGMVKQIVTKLGKVYEFEDLQFIVDECYSLPNYELAESIAFLRIAYTTPPINNSNKYTMKDLTKHIDTKNLPEVFTDYSKQNKELTTIYVFRGWVWSTYQERNSLINPIYDVVLVRCI